MLPMELDCQLASCHPDPPERVPLSKLSNAIGCAHAAELMRKAPMAGRRRFMCVLSARSPAMAGMALPLETTPLTRYRKARSGPAKARAGRVCTGAPASRFGPDPSAAGLGLGAGTRHLFTRVDRGVR